MSGFFEVHAASGGPSSYQATLDDEWRYADRVFGGYTTALALYCAWLSAPLPVLASAHAMFVSPVSPGPVTVEVSTLRAGGSAVAQRVLLAQHGTTALWCDAWFLRRAPRPLGPPADPRRRPLDGAAPELGGRIDWLDKVYPFMDTHFDTRAHRYPRTPDDSVGAEEGIALSARPARDWGLPPEVQPWVTDVLLLDAYLLDPALWRYGMDQVTGFSLDLNISWSATNSDPTGWSRLEAGCQGDGDFVVCTGHVIDDTGAIRAQALQHGKLTRT